MTSFLNSWLFSTHLFDPRRGCQRKSICGCRYHQLRPFLDHKLYLEEAGGWPLPGQAWVLADSFSKIN